MKNQSDIYSLANYSLNLAQQKDSNLKCAEVYFDRTKYINIEIEENSVKNSEIGSDYGGSIRCFNNKGSLGFAYTNKLEKISISKMVKQALSMMNAGMKDSNFKNLPKKYDKYPTVKGLFHKATKELTIEDSLGYVEDVISVCDNDELAISQTANFSSNYLKSYIFNSNGLEAQRKATYCLLSSNIILKDNTTKENSFGYDWQAERRIEDLNAVQIATNALEEGKRNLNRKKIKNMKVPLILTPNSTISFILNPLSSAINAENFQYKRSFLIEKRGEIIGSELLNIRDNALLEGAVGSKAFDGEGIPCKNKVIIEKGKFLKTGLLHNNYTANKEGIQSSGNASRSSYSSIPKIGTTNFIMEPGTFSKEEMIKEVKEVFFLFQLVIRLTLLLGTFQGSLCKEIL